jgi:dihydrofolate reductase
MWNMMSLDGFFDGAQPWSIDWFGSVFDEELERFSIEQLRTAEMLLFGRETYRGMAEYWSSAEGEDAGFMNRLPKVVFSRTLDRAEWANSKVLSGDAAAEVRRLKQSGEGNILVFGSGQLSSALIEQGLFDEYRLGVVPIILGTGKPLFGRGLSSRKLKLLEARALSSGCVILRYAPL